MESVADLMKVTPFNFDNCKRNTQLPPAFLERCTNNFTKTGTTITGLIYRGGVILAADTRSTAGPVVANKNKKKIARITDRMYMAGSGTAADTLMVGRLASSSLRLHEYKTGREPLVQSAVSIISNHLFNHLGYVSAYVILGGVDYKGAHLCSIDAHGSVNPLPFVTQGSGSLAAQAMLEKYWRADMEEEDAVKCACKAIEAGILNDLGSGSNVDVVIIRLDGTTDVRQVIAQPGTLSAQKPRGTYPDA